MEKPHKNLDVWNTAMEVVVRTYQATQVFPSREIYSLTDQIRRAAVSIPSNIAEGAARRSKKEFINYLHIAQGSVSELDTQLEIARRLTYLGEEAFKDLETRLERVDKMLSGLIRQLKR